MALYGEMNCNIKQLCGIRGYSVEKIELALMDQFLPKNAFNKNKTNPEGRKFVGTTAAFIYFTQGSEDSKVLYARALAKKIKELELGEVWASKNTPSPLHGGKPTRMFVWRIDHKALKVWANNKLKQIADNAIAEEARKAGNIPKVEPEVKGTQQ